MNEEESDMPVRSSCLVPLTMLVLAPMLLTGCGASETVGSASNAHPTSSAHPSNVATPPKGTPGTGGTNGTNVTITTDRLSYTSTDAIHVTVTNQTGQPIFGSDGRTSCTILDVHMKTGTGWQTATIAPCSQNSTPAPVEIAPHASYTAVIALQTLPQGASAAFPSGTYRLALSYSTYMIPPPRPSSPREGAPLTALQGTPPATRAPSPLTTVYSAPFVVR